MNKFMGQKRAVQYLYPAIDPFDQQMIEVGDGHRVYVEQSGNPNGRPVIVCHGGPGGGSSPAMRRFFCPKTYRIILFDQRGCGKSTPAASVSHNTTWDLIADMERIRELLGLEQWIVFGGSWGATLSLLYAQTHPERATHLVLRGVFTMTQAELDWFYGGGAAHFWPEAWAKFCAPIPPEERGDMIGAYHKRLFSGDLPLETKCGIAWSAWENALASTSSNGQGGEAPGPYSRIFARLENHYFTNQGFLEFDGQILAHMDRIAHIPGFIVQGRYDMICPPATAHTLASAWRRCDLRMIRDAGHAMSEPGISAELVRIMDRIAGL